MKNLLILAMLTIFIFACKDEGAAGPMSETQYTLEDLENDTNWVEVTDYELLEIPCLKVQDLEEKYYFQNDEDYQDLSNFFYDNSSCTFNTLPEINFDEEEVIGVSFIDYPLEEYDYFQMKVFYNSNEKKITVYCEAEYDTTQSRNELAFMYRKWIKKSTDSFSNELELIYNSNSKE